MCLITDFLIYLDLYFYFYCLRLLPLTHLICAIFSGSAATKSVPERPDEHVRAKHREGLRLGDNEAM
jgi:hypothetical protein